MRRSRTAPSAAAYLPSEIALPALAEAAAGCRGCRLWERGTQTVFGEGAAGALVMLVGEQPGDAEDRAGRPFAGPAGRLLDSALEEAGLGRSRPYVTNVVKHFKWEERGKRRIHSKPDAVEIAACLPWPRAELEAVRPRALVCLGATAAQALPGRFLESELAPFVVATIHPSAILRARTGETRRAGTVRFVSDLRRVAEAVAPRARRAR